MKSQHRLRWHTNILVFLIVALVTSWYLNNSFGHVSADTSQTTQLLKYNDQQLAQYNGDDPTKPVFLALDGYVYDVTSGRSDYYDPNKSYHYLVGKDSSKELHLFGGEIIKRKYQVIGIYQQ